MPPPGSSKSQGTPFACNRLSVSKLPTLALVVTVILLLVISYVAVTLFAETFPVTFKLVPVAAPIFGVVN